MYKFMKWFTIWLFVWMVFFSIVNKLKAEDVYIYHQNYGNTHQKWKNRLEDVNHTVTSSTSAPNSWSSYEQVIDLRYSSADSLPTSDYKSILQNGGTIVLNGEHASFQNRNNLIQAFVRDVTSDNSIVYSTSLMINYDGNNEEVNNTSILSSLPGDWSYFNVAAAGVISDLGDNGKCIAQNRQGYCAVALFDGDSLSSAYSSGKVIVITDINYASSSGYYTTDNQEFLTSLISDVTTSTVVTYTPTASISSSQQTEVNTAKNKSQTTNQIYLTQSGNGLDLDIVQDGDNNLIIGTNLTSAGSIQGDNNEITLTQTNDGNVIGIDVNGNANDVDIVQNTNQNAIVNIAGASNTLDLEQLHLNNNGSHYSKVTVNGNSNSLTIDQKETGDKILFLDVDSSNNVQVDQKGTGDHYLNIILTDSHTLDITQDGSGDHDAHINLSGNNTSITLTQDSATDQNYYLEQNCVSASCSATVTQN